MLEVLDIAVASVEQRLWEREEWICSVWTQQLDDPRPVGKTPSEIGGCLRTSGSLWSDLAYLREEVHPVVSGELWQGTVTTLDYPV